MYNESYFKNQRQFPRRKIEDFYIKEKDEARDDDFTEKTEKTEKAEETAVVSDIRNENIPETAEKDSNAAETFSEREAPTEAEVFHDTSPRKGAERKNVRKNDGGFLSSIFRGVGNGGLFSGLSGIFNRLQEDDVVLAAVFFIIFNENNEDDILLLFILGALFFT